MEVLDLIQSAAFKAGVISSFNPDELPGDIIECGVHSLTNEILPSLNCDRTIDITQTSRVYTPVNGVIVLTPQRPRENFYILGHSRYTSSDLVKPENWYEEIRALHPTWVSKASDGNLFPTDEWPTDDFGQRIDIAFWSLDTRLIYANTVQLRWQANIMPDVNIDFPPMRVDAVLEEGNRIEYTYLYRDEFEKVISPAIPGCYAVEEYDDRTIVHIKGSPLTKRLVLPVPLQIVNQNHSHAGTIIAPPKFRPYLTDCCAVSLAMTYGVSSLEEMKSQAAKTYQLLKKNKTQPLHELNVGEQITKTIRHGIRWGGRTWR